MVATVEQIKKELSAIETATAAMAEDFKGLYKNYLKALSQAARRQLILASYYLCTQAYPEAFLRLPVSQRQQLQKNLRGLGDDLRNRLVTLLETGSEGWQNAVLISDSSSNLLSASEERTDTPGEPTSEVTEGLEETADNSEQKPDAAEELESSTAESEQGEKSGEVALADMPFVQAMLMNAMLEAMDPDMAADADADQPLTPSRLAKRHFFVEQRIRVTLNRISNMANRLLQKMEVLPDLPEAILAAATDADIPLEKTASAPNLLNVLVEVARDGQGFIRDPRDSDGDDAALEAEDEDGDEDEDGEDEDRDNEGDEERRNTTHLVAIHLRLSDIEFADTQASLWRSKLREALGKLKQLGRRYQKKQEERAIAEAELAWRSIWYDDAPRDEPSEKG